MATQALALTPGTAAALPERIAVKGPASPKAELQTGGPIRETSIYVLRDADRELAEGLDHGDLCYVLAATQSGKSSLAMRAMRDLQKAGASCIFVDMTSIGSGATSEGDLLHSLAWMLGRRAGLRCDVDAFWTRHAGLTPVHRWTLFLQEELLPSVQGRLVVILDEVGALLGASFPATDFFASLREIHNGREREPLYDRIAFLLLGIASPKALMKDAARTPFGTGRCILLEDFTREEARALLPALGGGAGAEAVLDAVLRWTHGHPYMTQRVCDLLVRQFRDEAGSVEDRVRAAVREAFFNEDRMQDTNLQYAEAYITRTREGVSEVEMLYLYRRLLRGETVASAADSLAQEYLVLSGMAAVRGPGRKRRLEVRNRIFAETFDLAWVERREAELVHGEAFRNWLAAPEANKEKFVLRGKDLEEALKRAASRLLSGPEEKFLRESQAADTRERTARRRVWALSATVLTLFFFLGVLVREWRQASNERHEAETQRQVAEEARKVAEEQQALAAAAAEEAREQAALAKDAQTEAELLADANDVAARAADAERSAAEARVATVLKDTENQTGTQETRIRKLVEALSQQQKACVGSAQVEAQLRAEATGLNQRLEDARAELASCNKILASQTSRRNQ